MSKTDAFSLRGTEGGTGCAPFALSFGISCGPKGRENAVDYIRDSRETRQTLNIRDPQPVIGVQSLWQSIGLAATIGIFLLMFGVFLRERDYRFSAIAALVLLIVAAGCVSGAYLAPSMAG